MAKFARLLDSLFKSLGGWIVMPAVAIAVGTVIWAPEEIAHQYRFEKLRYDYGGWLFLVFWMAIVLFVSACTARLLQLIRDQIVDGYKGLRRRSAIRRALTDLTPDEVVVMFVLLTSYVDGFQAGDGCVVVRKLRLTGLVEFAHAPGLGRRVYRVPAEVWRELPRFKERWQKVVEARGVNSPEQLQTLVRTILALPSVEH